MTAEQVKPDRRPLFLGVALAVVLVVGGYFFYRQGEAAGRLSGQIDQLRADVAKAEKAAVDARAAIDSVKHALSAAEKARTEAEQQAKAARSAAAVATAGRATALKELRQVQSAMKLAREKATKQAADLAAAKALIEKLQADAKGREANQSRAEKLVATYRPQIERLIRSDVTVDHIRGSDAQGNILENGLVLMNLRIQPRGSKDDEPPFRAKRVTIHRYDFARAAQPHFLDIEATGVTIPVARLKGPARQALEKSGIKELVGRIRYDAYYDEKAKIAAIRHLDVDIEGFGRLSLSLSYGAVQTSRSTTGDVSKFARFHPAETQLRSLTVEVVNRAGYQVLMKGIAAMEGTSEGLLVRNLTEAIVKARGAAEREKFTILVDIYDAALTFMKQRGGIRLVAAPVKPVSVTEIIKIAGTDPAALKKRLNVTIEALPRPY